MRVVKPEGKFQGNKQLTKHQNGERLTMKEMILAKCYECMCGYHDGARDCLIPECPLYPLMPYREGGPIKLRKGTNFNPSFVPRGV
jgi:Zn-finger protein